MPRVRIDYSNRFIKSLKKAPRKIQIAFRNRLELFLIDKYHFLLNNHNRIIYFDFLGTHSQLYK